MADMFENAAAWFDSQRRSFFSRDITISGGGLSATTVKASIGSSVFETTNDYGAIERWEARDYIITRTDLARLPEPGDIISETIGGTTYTYEVVSPRGIPVWEPADSYNVAISIHTKLISR